MQDQQGCDLMLFENVFQQRACHQTDQHSCDLMLFENVFQPGSLAD